MPISRSVALFLVCCIFPLFSSASLSDDVCRSIKDYEFCKGIINSEPNLPPNDPINIGYAAFRRASDKVGDVLNEIKSEIKRVGHCGGLNKCLYCYTSAARSLHEALGNLDSETYVGLDVLSVEVKSNVSACYKGYHRRNVYITEGNVYMMKVTDICYAVALLL